MTRPQAKPDRHLQKETPSETSPRRDSAANPPSTSGVTKKTSPSPPTFSTDEEWVQEYKKQFGEEPSFF